MLEGGLSGESNRIFMELLDLANKEFAAKGINIQPSVIVGKIISPLKDLYLKNLAELLETYLKNNS